jgi:hypothetical protein
MNEDEYQSVPFGYGVPQQQKNDRADLLDKIKPDKIVELIRHRLLGEQLLNSQWVAVRALEDRKLTEVGAWELSNLMLGVSSINISLSKLNDNEIKVRLLSISKTAQRMSVANWRRYGIHSTAQLWFIHEVIFSNTLGVLKQADNASIQELLKGTIQESRIINTDKTERGGRIKKLLGLG